MDQEKLPVGGTVILLFAITYGAGQILGVLPESTPVWISIKMFIAMIGIIPLIIFALMFAFLIFSLAFLILWGIALILHWILPGRAWRQCMNRRFPMPGIVAGRFVSWLFTQP